MNTISFCKLLTTQEFHLKKFTKLFQVAAISYLAIEKKGIHLKFRGILRWRDGTLVGAFVSHQFGPESNSRGDDICKFSLLLILTLAPKGFSPDTPLFPSPQKTIISKFLIRSGSGMVNEFEPLCECATQKALYTHYKLFSQIFHGMPKCVNITRAPKSLVKPGYKPRSLSTFFNHIQTGLFLRFL